MPEIKGIENIAHTIAFIIPGMIILFVRSQFITGRTPPFSEAVVPYLIMTLIYYGLNFFFVNYVYKKRRN